MKILKLLLFNLTFFNLVLPAQNDSAKAPPDALSKADYSTLFKKQFTDVANNSDKTTVGNFASADIKEGKLAFNATRTFDNGDFLSINANGSITDGFFSIFSESQINANAGADFKYSHLFAWKSAMASYTGAGSKLNMDLEKVTIQKQLKNEIALIDSIKSWNDCIKFRNEYKHDTDSLRDLNNKYNALGSGIPKSKLHLEIVQLEQHMDSLQLRMNSRPRYADVLKSNDKWADSVHKSIVENFDYTKIRFFWFSLGGGFLNNNFKEFNPAFNSLDSQLIKQNYTTKYLTAEFNWYSLDKKTERLVPRKPKKTGSGKRRKGIKDNMSFYFSIQTRINWDDNFSDLDKIELSDVQQYGDSILQRSTTKKIVAYTGNYKTDLLGGKTSIDFYKFIFANNGALHFFGNVNYRQHSLPVYNAGFGLLFSFKNSKDKNDKGKVNAELYFKLNDLTNNKNSDLDLMKRNELGLRLTIPIKFFDF
jgi:hypothetical protein